MALLAVLAVLAALASACSGDEQPPPESIQVRVNGELIGEAPRREAAAAISERVGFPVTLATNLPDTGLNLIAIDARLASGIEEMGDDGRTNHAAIVTYVAGVAGSPDSTAVRVIEYSRPQEPLESAEPVSIDGETIHLAVIGPGGRSFSWDDGNRGYIVEVGEPVGTEDISTGEVLTMLQSMR